MIVKGRCRGNGAQLAQYLLNTQDNDRAEFLAMYGAASRDERRALLEMSLTSEIHGRTKNGLYHTQLSPRAHEAADMTPEQKMRMVEIMAEQMGMQGHKWWMSEHEKDGRIHQHLVFERYNHDSGLMWASDQNYAKHQKAARQMEMEFGWQITHENKRFLDQEIKDHILNLWGKNQDAAEFVQAMDKAGFEVTQGIDRRPFQIVDQYGTVHDLSRQLKGVKQGQVSERLNNIRSELRHTADASQDRRQEHEREIVVPAQSEPVRDLAESQDLAAAMIEHVRKDAVPEKEKFTGMSYGFKIEMPPAPAQHPEPEKQADHSRDLSDSQNLAAAMINHQRQKEADRESKVQEAQQQAREQTQPANDNQPQKYYNPVTGQEMTADAYQKLQEFLDRQKQREQERDAKRRDRGRDGYNR